MTCVGAGANVLSSKPAAATVTPGHEQHQENDNWGVPSAMGNNNVVVSPKLVVS